MARAKMGELRRAAQQLAVTGTVLRQHGAKSASAARIEAVKADPPRWLTRAQQSRRDKRAKQKLLRDRKTTAARLGVQVRAVQARGINPGDVDALPAGQPAWLAVERQRPQAQVEQEAKERLRADLSEALVTSVHEVWFQELKRAATDEEADAIDGRWAAEVCRAEQEARRLVEELTPAQVRARIEREQQSANAAGLYRATQLLRRAVENNDG